MKSEYTVIIIFFLCSLLCFFVGCYIGRNHNQNTTPEATILIETDTVYIQSAVEVDTVIFEGESEQRIKFQHSDNKIEISGSIYMPSKRLELSYYIKPIEIQIIGDTAISSTDYNITLTPSPLTPEGLPRERFVVYSGIAYYAKNKKIDPCIMAGIKFGRVTIMVGMTGTEIYTAGVSYGF